MSKVRNILFIMSDQLRWDMLSCAGHPTLQTPHIDALARRGVSFTRAYCQAPICGPSRMSFYTGRYPFSHGATWNNVPLDIGELTLGDYLRPSGVRTALAGKTHFRPDIAGLERLGIAADDERARYVIECGFEPYEREEGLHPGRADTSAGYNRYLVEQGYVSDNPWLDFANSAQGPNGEIHSGWHMRYAREPARVAAEHSETAYLTDRGMDFIRDAGDAPWCLHLSYIKPHWPYVAPAPYNALYDTDALVPANRTAAEQARAHPVVRAFMDHPESRTFATDEARRTVVPTYMGLVKQLDDELGRLFAAMDSAGRFEDTLIVFTSDHGDYLGDHWLGEKELFHEESARIPMIVYDPDTGADATRGTEDDRLVESIDLVPTFVEAVGGQIDDARLEGRSLLPLLRRNGDVAWRTHVVSEIDYAFRPARRALGRTVHEARATMVCDGRWKYIHYNGFPPQLFDLDSDPAEQADLGADPGYAHVRAELQDALVASLAARRTRTTISPQRVEALTGSARERGFHFGQW